MILGTGFVFTQAILKIVKLKLQFPKKKDCHDIYKPILQKMF